MKKILVVHNKYKLVGGEDIAVDNEILFLSKFYDVETLFFENKINNTILQVFYFLINRNFESKKYLEIKSIHLIQMLYTFTIHGSKLQLTFLNY